MSNDPDFEKKIEELDENFKKWNLGMKEANSKLGIEQPKIEIKKSDPVEIPETENEEENEINDNEIPSQSSIRNNPELTYPVRSYYSRYSSRSRHLSKKRNRNKILLVIALLIPQPFIFYFYINYFPWIGPIEPYIPFSIKVQDGVSGEQLDNDYFEYNLYATNDPSNSNDYLLIENDYLDSLRQSDFDDYRDDYAHFIMEYHGDIEGKIYYSRWIEIDLDGENYLVAYAMPSSFWMNVFFNNLTFVNKTKGTDENINFIVCSNESEPDRALVMNFDYEIDEYVNPCLRMTFEKNISYLDFDIFDPGNYKLPKMRKNLTCYEYRIPRIDFTYDLYEGKWNFHDNRIINIELTWNNQILTTW